MTKLIIKNKMINWICLGEQCPANCCGPYKVDKSHESLWGVEEKLLPLTPDDYRLMVKNGFLKNLVKKADGGWYLKSKKCGSCPFLKMNKCSIYYLGRASTCKSYPFFFSKYNGLYGDMTCPGWGKGWTSMSKVKEMVDELIKLYDYQIEKAKGKLND